MIMEMAFERQTRSHLHSVMYVIITYNPHHNGPKMPTGWTKLLFKEICNIIACLERHAKLKKITDLSYLSNRKCSLGIHKHMLSEETGKPSLVMFETLILVQLKMVMTFDKLNALASEFKQSLLFAMGIARWEVLWIIILPLPPSPKFYLKI